MVDLVVPNCYIGDAAEWALVPLVNRCEENGEAGLCESTPYVFEYVSLEEDPLGIFQFEMVLDDIRIAGVRANKIGLTGFPDHGLEQMVATDLYVRRRGSSWSSAKQNVFTGSLQEIIQDLVRSPRCITTATIDGLRVCAGAFHGNAMEIAEIGVNHSYIGCSTQMYAALGFILRGSV